MSDFWHIVFSAFLSAASMFAVKRALTTGEWHFRFNTVLYRADHPNWFRLTIAFGALVAVVFAAFAIYLTATDILFTLRTTPRIR